MRGQLPDPSSDAASVREQAIGTPETLEVGKQELCGHGRPGQLTYGRWSLRNFCVELCAL